MPLRSSDGARTPAHSHTAPFEPFTFPESFPPLNVPSNFMSSGVSSSDFGETKFNFPSLISAFGSGRAFPHRPTYSAFNWPPSSRKASHEGYSLSAAFNVKSHRPRYALTSTDDDAELSFVLEARTETTKIPHKIANPTRLANRCIFICPGSFIFLRMEIAIDYASKKTVSRSPCR